MGIASELLPYSLAGDFPPVPPNSARRRTLRARPQARSSKPTILLVEDNASDVHVIKLALMTCGIEMDVAVASDGEIALAMLEEAANAGDQWPALILLDWNLPRVSGAEILAYTREVEQLRSVPVVVVSSATSPMEIKEFERLGATAHFPKPTDLDAYLGLRTIVLDVLGRPPRQ